MCIEVPAKRSQTQNTTVGTAKKGGKLLPCVCSTFVLICFTCPAITVATVILWALDRVRGRALGWLGPGSPKSLAGGNRGGKPPQYCTHTWQDPPTFVLRQAEKARTAWEDGPYCLLVFPKFCICNDTNVGRRRRRRRLGGEKKARDSACVIYS